MKGERRDDAAWLQSRCPACGMWLVLERAHEPYPGAFAKLEATTTCYCEPHQFDVGQVFDAALGADVASGPMIVGLRLDTKPVRTADGAHPLWTHQ